jgi:hypothetical protein
MSYMLGDLKKMETKSIIQYKLLFFPVTVLLPIKGILYRPFAFLGQRCRPTSKRYQPLHSEFFKGRLISLLN